MNNRRDFEFPIK